jgi:hypothetical protein
VKTVVVIVSTTVSTTSVTPQETFLVKTGTQ